METFSTSLSFWSPVTCDFLLHNANKVKLWCFSLMSVWTRCWTNTRMAGDLTCHDTVMTSMLCGFKKRWKCMFLLWMVPDIDLTLETIIIPPALTKLKGGILVSPCPSIPLSIRLSVCLSVRPSVCLWTESCPLCIFNNTHWIHFIFPQATSEGVPHVMFVSKLEKNKILANFQLWLCLLLTWDPIWINNMGNHEVAGGILRMQAF